MSLKTLVYDSPIGPLRLVASDTALTVLIFTEDRGGKPVNWQALAGGPAQEVDELPPYTTALEAYFQGQIDALENLTVELRGTSFQQRVWKELRRIPPGHTWSYGQLAQAIGKPTAVRAVGLANGRNPVSLVVPCHRVIGADGSLTGYGGGMDRKRWLLEHEGSMKAAEPRLL